MKALDLFAVSVAALAGGFGLLLVLGSMPPAPAPPEETPKPPPRPSPRPGATPSPVVPDPDRYVDRVRSLNTFLKSESGGSYTLGYGFIDHHGKTHSISCQISKADYEREAAAFGYNEAEHDAALDARLQAWVEGELKAMGLAEHVQVTVYGHGAYHSEYRLPGSMQALEATLLKLLDEEFPRKRAALARALFKERGFLLEKDGYGLDYAGIALRSGPALADCFRALAEAGRGYNPRQYLGLFVAFFQEIRYEVPPDVVRGRKTVGLWVPTEVLVNDHGDCDSKSVAFSSLWRNFGSPVLLVVLPDHVLIGAEVKPRPGDKYVLVRNRYYVLAEVAGPGKSHPGEPMEESWIHISGHFEYTLVGGGGGTLSQSTRGESGS